MFCGGVFPVVGLSLAERDYAIADPDTFFCFGSDVLFERVDDWVEMYFGFDDLGLLVGAADVDAIHEVDSVVE